MYVVIFKSVALLAVKKTLKGETHIYHLGRQRTLGEITILILNCVLHWFYCMPSLL